MSTQLQIALCEAPQPFDGNGFELSQIEALLRNLSGKADLLLLPEMALTGFAYRRAGADARRMRDSVAAQLFNFVKSSQVALALTVPWPLESDPSISGGGPKATNRLLFITPESSVPKSYDKIHLIGFGGFQEPQFYSPGNQTVTITWREWKIGFAICYDLRFPELFRQMSADGVDLVLMPAQWPQIRLRHLDILARARAIENSCYLAICNANGRWLKTDFPGKSAIYTPDGETLTASLKVSEATVYTISGSELADWRTRLPVLGDRRL